MKLSFNFGTGIFLFYGLFMIGIVTMVIKSTRHDPNLVVEEYYKADLAYQAHYEKLLNRQQLSGEIDVTLSDDGESVAVHFPKEIPADQGEILLYNPQDNQQDIRTAIALDEHGRQLIPLKNQLSGRWRIKIDWTANGKAYYEEQEVWL